MEKRRDAKEELRRFQGQMNNLHGKSLLKFKFNGTEFDIRATDHTYEHLERKYDMNVICGDIVALGKERLYEYAARGEDVAIIDQDNNLTTIITFEGTQIRIRTVIDKSRVWVKKGTKIYNLR